jgi:hypothetical protein
VLTRQLDIYLADNFTDEQRENCTSAPSHNMSGERAMAIGDHHTRRAPNARGDFIEAKVKAKANGSHEWLQQQSADKRTSIIKFSVGQARKTTAEKLRQHKAVQDEVIARMAASAKEKDAKEKRALMKDAEKDGVRLAASIPVSAEDISAAARCSLSASTLQFCVTMLNDPSALVGTKFVHRFEDENNSSELVIYIGEIVKKKRRKNIAFDVAYVKASEGLESQQVEVAERKLLLTDLLLGDVYCV